MVDFIQWVSQYVLGISLREQCREEYCQATRHLARLQYREGRPDLAVPPYRILLKLDPTLEDIVRDLCRCYRRLMFPIRALFASQERLSTRLPLWGTNRVALERFGCQAGDGQDRQIVAAHRHPVD